MTDYQGTARHLKTCLSIMREDSDFSSPEYKMSKISANVFLDDSAYFFMDYKVDYKDDISGATCTVPSWWVLDALYRLMLEPQEIDYQNWYLSGRQTAYHQPNNSYYTTSASTSSSLPFFYPAYSPSFNKVTSTYSNRFRNGFLITQNNNIQKDNYAYGEAGLVLAGGDLQLNLRSSEFNARGYAPFSLRNQIPFSQYFSISAQVYGKSDYTNLENPFSIHTNWYLRLIHSE